MARAAAALCLALLAWQAPARAAEPLAIVLSEPGGVYAEVAAALRNELPADVPVQEAVHAPAPDAALKPRLVVAIGASACGAVARLPGPPALCALLPRAAYERIAAGPGSRSRRLSAVFLDQPPGRQMALVRLVLPSAASVAMLFGPESAATEGAHAAAAARHGLRPLAAKVAGPEELYPALQRLLEAGADVLLAVPDSLVYNAGTLQNLLRASIRSRVPMLAFGPAYVRAGALAAVHSTPQQAGRQAGLVAREVLAGRALPAPQHAAEFAVALNPVVARSLGLDLADVEVLAARLRAQEKAQ